MTIVLVLSSSSSQSVFAGGPLRSALPCKLGWWLAVPTNPFLCHPSRGQPSTFCDRSLALRLPCKGHATTAYGSGHSSSLLVARCFRLLSGTLGHLRGPGQLSLLRSWHPGSVSLVPPCRARQHIGGFSVFLRPAFQARILVLLLHLLMVLRSRASDRTRTSWVWLRRIFPASSVLPFSARQRRIFPLLLGTSAECLQLACCCLAVFDPCGLDGVPSLH